MQKFELKTKSINMWSSSLIEDAFDEKNNNLCTYSLKYGTYFNKYSTTCK